MLLKNRATPRTLVRVSMVCLLIFFSLGVVVRFTQPLTPFWDGIVDGMRGAQLGAAIALIFLGRRALTRNRVT